MHGKDVAIPEGREQRFTRARITNLPGADSSAAAQYARRRSVQCDAMGREISDETTGSIIVPHGLCCGSTLLKFAGGRNDLDSHRCFMAMNMPTINGAARNVLYNKVMSAQVGEANANGQILVQKTNVPSANHRFARVWIVRCPKHGTYKANSCDFHIRKCPNEGGQPGLA